MIMIVVVAMLAMLIPLIRSGISRIVTSSGITAIRTTSFIPPISILVNRKPSHHYWGLYTGLGGVFASTGAQLAQLARQAPRCRHYNKLVNLRPCIMYASVAAHEAAGAGPQGEN